MVRSIAGALYSVGRGRLTPDDIAEILESKKRTHRIVTAPAKGLFLDKVFYLKPGFLYTEAMFKRINLLKGSCKKYDN